jgi:hypothetical protein
LAGLVQTHQEAMARLADAAFVRQEYHSLVGDERTALATLRTELGAAIDANQAQIVAVSQASANEDSALATQISTVSATAAGRNRTFFQATAPVGAVTGDLWFDTTANNRARRWSGSAWVDTSDTRIAANAAAVATEALARADADSALATQISTVSATAAGLEAEVETQATALATIEGNLSSSFVLRTRAGGAVGEVEVVAADGPSGPASAVVIRSDRFRFEGDFAEFMSDVIVGGRLVVGAAFQTVYRDAFSGVVQASNGATQDILQAEITEGASSESTFKVSFDVVRILFGAASFDWSLDAVSTAFGGSNVKSLLSGSIAIPSGSGSFVLERSGVAYDHRFLVAGSSVRLRLTNITGQFSFKGSMIVEQTLQIGE